MELNREQLLKALECCKREDLLLCRQQCKYYLQGDPTCIVNMAGDALALIDSQEQKIKELTEENERLKELGTKKEIEKELVRRETKADTIREMQRITKEQSFEHRYFGKIVYVDDIDQTAKEMLEELEK